VEPQQTKEHVHVIAVQLGLAFLDVAPHQPVFVKKTKGCHTISGSPLMDSKTQHLPLLMVLQDQNCNLSLVGIFYTCATSNVTVKDVAFGGKDVNSTGGSTWTLRPEGITLGSYIMH
jgi:hypothetical protein